jgi:chlorobactene glucosyltransferase
MTVIWVLTLLSAFAVMLFAASSALFRRRCPVLPPGDPPPGELPLISIVVPARNEAANIERCVRSLLDQRYPRIEIIAVDDASTDATPQILARLAAQDTRLKVLPGRPLRPGWTGKNNALVHGLRHTQGDWLLFVDADVQLEPGAVAGAYRAACEGQAAMVSLWARQETHTFWERCVQPLITGANLSVDPLLRCNSPRHPERALGNGQFILVERAAYQHTGGHEILRDEVLEDQRLSRNFKLAGYRVLMMDGSQVLRTRMYDSLQSLWEGWSKNNFLSLGRSLPLACACVVTTYLVMVNPFVLALWTLAATKFHQTFFDPLLINLSSVALLLWTRWRMRRFAPTPLRDYLTIPLGGLVFTGIIISSAYQHLRGRGVTWKGRLYGEETGSRG